MCGVQSMTIFINNIVVLVFFHLFNVFEWFARTYVCVLPVCLVPAEVKRRHETPGTGVTVV